MHCFISGTVPHINEKLGAFDCYVSLFYSPPGWDTSLQSPPVLLSVMMNTPLTLTRVFSYLLLALVAYIVKRNS
jgi:hypothetical protein